MTRLSILFCLLLTTSVCKSQNQRGESNASWDCSKVTINYADSLEGKTLVISRYKYVGVKKKHINKLRSIVPLQRAQAITLTEKFICEMLEDGLEHKKFHLFKVDLLIDKYIPGGVVLIMTYESEDKS